MKRICLNGEGTSPQGLEVVPYEDRIKLGGYWISRDDWEVAIKHDRAQMKATQPKASTAKKETDEQVAK